MNDIHPLTCQELVELITDYLEDTLPLTDRERFEMHLAECTGCQRYLDQMRWVQRLTGQLTEATAPPEATDKLLDVFRNWKENPDSDDPTTDED